MGGACGTYRGEEKYIQVFGGETWWEDDTERLRRSWKNNIKMDLKETGWKVVDWIDLAQDRDAWRVFVYTIVKLRAS